MPENSFETNCWTIPVSSTKRRRPLSSGSAHHARQGARRLHDRESRVAAEGILAREPHDEVQALVLDARKGSRGIEPERGQ